YEATEELARFEHKDGIIDTFTALALITKLRQITSGFIMRDGEPTGLIDAPERLAALRDIVEDVEGKIIIWASYREEIRQIVEMLSENYRVVEYHGGTK